MTAALSKVHPAAQAAKDNFHSAVVGEVAAAVAREKVVVVGMAWNPVVRKARRFLEGRGIQFHYLEYGNYLSGWKPRLAIKIWSGWPTFPQIFIQGTLVGGCADLEALAAKGELDSLLKA
jgi:glutaredoxin-related protein